MHVKQEAYNMKKFKREFFCKATQSAVKKGFFLTTSVLSLYYIHYILVSINNYLSYEAKIKNYERVKTLQSSVFLLFCIISNCITNIDKRMKSFSFFTLRKCN